MEPEERGKGEKSGDVRNVPKHVIKEFIEVYRSHPALWQLKKKEIYGNKNLKYTGHQALVQVWKKFDPEADIKMIKAKIQSIRGSFRKELKKVQKSLRSGAGTDEVYKPQLWYFDMLLFLSDHEIPTESVDNLSLCMSAAESIENLAGADSQLAVNEDEPEEIQQTIPTGLPNTSQGPLQQLKKKTKKLTEADERRSILAACTNALKCADKDVTEDEAFGTLVAKKLGKVKDDFQRMLAEQLITKTLNYAILGRLTEDVDLKLDPHIPSGRSYTTSSTGTIPSCYTSPKTQNPPRYYDWVNTSHSTNQSNNQ